jgi:hypothetical protein
MEKVTGSSPVRSTIKAADPQRIAAFGFFAAGTWGPLFSLAAQGKLRSQWLVFDASTDHGFINDF